MQKNSLNVGPKSSYLGIFGLELEKAISIFQFFQTQNFVQKQKSLNLGPKLL